jgi:hypothetical protein
VDTVFEMAYVRTAALGQRREDRIELPAAPGVELLYSCFVGNVALRVGGIDFSANFGWIPLLHVANNLDLILHRLTVDETKTYYFTESEDWISFSERGGSVELRCSYIPDVVGIASREEAGKAVGLAALALVKSIEHDHPEASSNRIFGDIASRLKRNASSSSGDGGAARGDHLP